MYFENLMHLPAYSASFDGIQHSSFPSPSARRGQLACAWDIRRVITSSSRSDRALVGVGYSTDLNL